MERLIFDQGTLFTGDMPCSAEGFIWLDCGHEEVAADPEGFRQEIEKQTGIHLFDEHLLDCTNLQHPSFFDATRDYDMIVFRKLVTHSENKVENVSPSNTPSIEELSSLQSKPLRHTTLPSALPQIQTRPVTFFCSDRALITIRNPDSRTFSLFRSRLAIAGERKSGAAGQAVTGNNRLPHRPEELMLRILNVMVDRYLDLRAPLTQQLDRWQRALLDTRRVFSNWSAVLDTGIELRRLEALSEEQYDALQEFRDSTLDQPESPARESLLVRINDVMEHVQRVLSHARRLEATVESAVQLNFSAQAQRTSRIVQILTVVTVILAPLNLLAGIYGMNFEKMPGKDHPYGFWFMLATMGGLAAIMAAIFSAKRYIERSR